MTLEDLSDDILNNLLKYEMVKYPIYVPSRKRSDIFLLGIKKIKNYFRLKINVKNEIFYLKNKAVF